MMTIIGDNIHIIGDNNTNTAICVSLVAVYSANKQFMEYRRIFITCFTMSRMVYCICWMPVCGFFF